MKEERKNEGGNKKGGMKDCMKGGRNTIKLHYVAFVVHSKTFMDVVGMQFVSPAYVIPPLSLGHTVNNCINRTSNKTHFE